eukprot:6546824-Prymnesium_polylepis.1
MPRGYCPWIGGLPQAAPKRTASVGRPTSGTKRKQKRRVSAHFSATSAAPAALEFEYRSDCSSPLALLDAP